jgi:hypothetical protein
MTSAAPGVDPNEALELDVTPEKLAGIQEALGRGGIGSFVVREVLGRDQLDLLQEEVDAAVTWEDTHTEYDNVRGMHIVQNHDTFALKLGVGDQSPFERIPRLFTVAQHIQTLVRGTTGGIFPVLESWEVNELSLHQYDDAEVGLSPHKDNIRYSGVVAVLNVKGISDLELIEEETGLIYSARLNPGDLSLTRVSGIYTDYDENGRRKNICPDHAVTNLRTPTRTSFILRDNSRPHEEISGFNFANWP